VCVCRPLKSAFFPLHLHSVCNFILPRYPRLPVSCVLSRRFSHFSYVFIPPIIISVKWSPDRVYPHASSPKPLMCSIKLVFLRRCQVILISIASNSYLTWRSSSSSIQGVRSLATHSGLNLPELPSKECPRFLAPCGFNFISVGIATRLWAGRSGFSGSNAWSYTSAPPIRLHGVVFS
jgi:hypothetical protein